MRTVRPAGPSTFSRTLPTMFWPRSKIQVPGAGWVSVRAGSSCTTRTGGSAWATNFAVAPVSSTVAGSHVASSKPGVSQPAGSRRASNVSPWMVSVCRNGPGVACHESSVVRTSLRPSAYSTSSRAIRCGRSP